MGITRNIIHGINKGFQGILRTKPYEIHGINPSLTFLPNGKTIPLPRFCSVEMKQAVKMNKIAVQQAKIPIKKVYTKATPEDLKKLTSKSIEYSYSRAVWTNPKDGKVYNILKTGENKDGNIIVRILDEDGGFVKEATLTPKTIGIPDDYTAPTYILNIPHGNLVMTYAKRTNPFANYVPFNINAAQIARYQDLDYVNKYLKQGGKLDYLSCSYGSNIYTKNKAVKTINSTINEFYDMRAYHDKLCDKGIRVFSCSGNLHSANGVTANELSNDILSFNQKVEGVGSLKAQTGKISDFSLSRSNELTQHYEVGEFNPTLTSEGLNITGLSGTDLKFPTEKLKELSKNPLIGQSTDRVQKLLINLRNRTEQTSLKIAKLFRQEGSISDITKAKAKLEAEKSILEGRRRKIFNYTSQLTQKDGKYQAELPEITGTSFSTPIRTAKIALNEMMEGII